MMLLKRKELVTKYKHGPYETFLLILWEKNKYDEICLK